MRTKPWCISSAVANPDKLRGFLGVLAELQGGKWNHAAQVEFQIRLVQERLYGLGHCGLRFHANMPRDEVVALQLAADIPYATAERMFASAGFKDAPLRGRRLFAPLQWCGFADIRNGRVAVTDFGRALLAEERNCGKIASWILAKWQIPNPLDGAKFPAGRGYNIKPFGGFLRLVMEVNRLCKLSGMGPKGMSLDECGIFALTMTDWRDAERTAREVLSFRQRVWKIAPQSREKFSRAQARALRPEFALSRVGGKAEETVRFFRMTGIIQYEESEHGMSVNVSPFRGPEIAALAGENNAAPARFRSAEEYKAFLGACPTVASVL